MRYVTIHSSEDNRLLTRMDLPDGCEVVIRPAHHKTGRPPKYTFFLADMSSPTGFCEDHVTLEKMAEVLKITLGTARQLAYRISSSGFTMYRKHWAITKNDVSVPRKATVLPQPSVASKPSDSQAVTSLEPRTTAF